jgi:hypothetical protein
METRNGNAGLNTAAERLVIPVARLCRRMRFGLRSVGISRACFRATWPCEMEWRRRALEDRRADKPINQDLSPRRRLLLAANDDIRQIER